MKDHGQYNAQAQRRLHNKHSIIAYNFLYNFFGKKAWNHIDLRKQKFGITHLFMQIFMISLLLHNGLTQFHLRWL